MKFNQTARSRWLASATAISLLAAGSVVAAAPAKTTAQPNIKPAVQSHGGSAMRAYIDPATGQFRPPTEDELSADARLSADAAAQSDGKSFKISTTASGAIRVQDTQGLLTESVIATKQADGTLEYSFVGSDGAEKSHDASSAAKLEEK